jgi:hypothetical protein
MLYNLEPHVDVSGDVWYNGQEIDTEFVNQLSHHIYTYITKKVRHIYLCLIHLTLWDIRDLPLQKIFVVGFEV